MDNIHLSRPLYYPRHLLLIFATTLLLLLSACGGGSGSSEPTPIPPTSAPVVTNNQAPSIQSASNISINENAEATIYTIEASDADGDSINYSLNGDDATLFSVNQTTGVITTVTNLDYENPSDNNADNRYQLQVIAMDSNGNAASMALTITVQNINELPKITSITELTIDENSNDVIYTITASDPENDPLQFSISGDDSDRFALDPVTGEITFLPPPNYEQPLDTDQNNAYELIIRVNDDSNENVESSLSIVVTNLDEGIQFTSSSQVTIAENTIDAIYTVQAVSENNSVLNFTLAGADKEAFAIDPLSGIIRTLAPINFEAPSDTDNNNQYDLTIIAIANNGSEARLNLSVMVNNANDAPQITSATTASVKEQSTSIVYTIEGSDEDGNSLSYALGGTDANNFILNAENGQLSFINSPDFESPLDDNGDNVYELEVSVTDSQNIKTSQNVTIRVDDVDGVPIFSSSDSVSISENTQSHFYTALARDDESSEILYSLQGSDAELFSLNENSGQLQLIASADFEVPQDENQDNRYELIIVARDNSNNESQLDLTVSVVNKNEAPTISAHTLVIAEQIEGVIFTAEAQDDDLNDSIRFELLGDDASHLTINTTSGELQFNNPPDYEQALDANKDNVYELVIKVTDEGNLSNQANLTIEIEDINNIPTFISATSVSVNENQTEVFYTASAINEEGSAMAYQLSGTDANLFTIDSSSGDIAFKVVADFEQPADLDQNNQYEVVLTASEVSNGDAAPSQSNVNLTVIVLGINEAPEFTSPASLRIREMNTDLAYTATAIDDEDGILTFNTLNGNDAHLFNFDRTTGELSFNEAPVFSDPKDQDNDNQYDLEITTTDSDGLTSTLALNIIVIESQPLDIQIVYPTVGANLGGLVEATTVRGYISGDFQDLSSIDTILVNEIEATLEAFDESSEQRTWQATLALDSSSTTYDINVSALNDGEILDAKTQTLVNRLQISQPVDFVFIETTNEYFVLDQARNAVIAQNTTTYQERLISGLGKGNGPAFGKPSSIAYDSSSQRLYVSDKINQSIFQIDIENGDRTLIAQTDDTIPFSFTLDSSMVFYQGNLYAAVSTNNSDVLIIDTNNDNSVSLLSGNSDTFNLNTVIDITINSTQNTLMILDKAIDNNQRLLTISLEDGEQSLLAEGEIVATTQAIAYDQAKDEIVLLKDNNFLGMPYSVSLYAIEINNNTGAQLNERLIINTIPAQAIEIVIDSASAKLFWLESITNIVYPFSDVLSSADFSRSDALDIIGSGSSLYLPTGLALDTTNNRLFSSDNFFSNYLEIDLDTAEKKNYLPLTTGVSPEQNPTDLYFNQQTKELYITSVNPSLSVTSDSERLNRVLTSDTIGGGVELNSMLRSPLFLDELSSDLLALNEDKILLIDDQGNRTTRVNFTTEHGITLQGISMFKDADDSVILSGNNAIYRVDFNDGSSNLQMIADNNNEFFNPNNQHSLEVQFSPQIVIQGQTTDEIWASHQSGYISSVNKISGQRSMLFDSRNTALPLGAIKAMVLDTVHQRLFVSSWSLRGIVVIDLITLESAVFAQ